MFRVVIMCDDRKLPDVLHALIGKVHGSPEVMPVINATVSRNGQVKAASSGDRMEMLASYIKQHKLQTMTANEMRAFCMHIGLSERSYGFVLTQAQEAGLLRKGGGKNSSRPVYKVVV